MRFRVELLGCKVNQYEAEQIRKLLVMKGLCEASESAAADLVVIHSCAVTSQAVRKVRQRARRNSRRWPAAEIVVSGCAAEPGIVDRDMPAFRYVRPGAGWLARLDQALSELGFGSGSNADGLSQDILPLEGFDNRRRAFLKIQDGCDIGCAYCIVPRLRGPSRDKDPGQILKEARMLVAAGNSEVVVTGVSVGLYGRESGIPLAVILDQLAGIKGVERLRLSSLHPAELTEELLEVWGRHANIMPHIHLPLQSGSDRILRKMRRGYTRTDFLAAVARARKRLDAPAFNTDVIVGFPGETETDFADTLALCREVGFARMHIFAYSPRPGTRGEWLAHNIPDSEVKRRAKETGTVARDLAEKFHRGMEGRFSTVLVESRDEDSGIWKGYSERYIPVRFSAGFEDVGEIARVRLREAADDGMVAERVKGTIP